jgi:hypothetical protein
MGLITERSSHYYSGQQSMVFYNGVQLPMKWVGDVDLVEENATNGIHSNFEVLINGEVQNPDSYYLSNGNSVNINGTIPFAAVILIRLLTVVVESNYGKYAYITLSDIINNFEVAYVGQGKLIPSAKRSDIIFHAKRGLQEFSYDTLKSVKSQELNIPPSLSLPLPQDYVNYVGVSYTDESGVKRKIYPTTLTSNPYTLLTQDNEGIPLQDSYGRNINPGFSKTEDDWKALSVETTEAQSDLVGQRYGLDPSTAQNNGWFTINEREGKFSFSSDLVNKNIIFEYISDGLAYDVDTKVPKMAEDAMYAHISYSILAGRANQPEYVVQRLKRDRSAKLRNAKIRLSNIKLSEIVQVMRNKSKQIK